MLHSDRLASGLQVKLKLKVTQTHHLQNRSEFTDRVYCVRGALWTSAFAVQITLPVMAWELTGQRHRLRPSLSLLYNIATQWTVWLALYPLFKFRLNDSIGRSLAFVAMLLLRETLCRAVLAAASPSLLGPSLLQEGSEAEDMVSLTVHMIVNDDDDGNYTQ